jgi:hypothetical protein
MTRSVPYREGFKTGLTGLVNAVRVSTEMASTLHDKRQLRPKRKRIYPARTNCLGRGGAVEMIWIA